jgi:hypothetical protein
MRKQRKRELEDSAAKTTRTRRRAAGRPSKRRATGAKHKRKMPTQTAQAAERAGPERAVS